ncbi:MAG: hypothetical protein ACT4P4_07950 [Betaproteobacteria bacterium]
MTLLPWIVTAAVLIALAAYAQIHIPDHTAKRSNTVLVRSLLAIVGAALGGLAAAADRDSGVPAPLLFLAGFGLVHAPAAIILFVKRLRGEGRS